jgi:hypothetical protein
MNRKKRIEKSYFNFSFLVFFSFIEEGKACYQKDVRTIRMAL